MYDENTVLSRISSFALLSATERKPGFTKETSGCSTNFVEGDIQFTCRTFEVLEVNEA